MSEDKHIVPIGQLYGLFGADCTPNQGIESGEASTQLLPKALSECCVCARNAVKYRCPACLSQTCSLDCSQNHKQLLSCKGLSDRTPFVKMTDFTQTQFISDYGFLEDTERVIDGCSRQRRSILSSAYTVPKWIKKLQKEARFRGTRLVIMPAGFQKRKQNSTCFMYDQKCIHWHIECKFPHALQREMSANAMEDNSDDLVASHSDYSLMSRRVPETTLLSQFLMNYLSPNDLIANYERTRKLPLYRNAGIDEISVLFRVESKQTKVNKYIEIDLNKTIKDNLVRKTIIEFPTFVIVLNKYKHLFDVCDEKNMLNKSK